MSKLNIYKASAGSGKTYQITGEYLKLLFSDSTNFKQTLAVTFTNKATDEMKSRIIEQIYKLSIGSDSGYKASLMSDYNLSSEEIQRKAQELLFLILHNYSWFSVTTIDSFFQRIVRSFARETGLQAGFNLEIDQDRVLNSVCDSLLDSLSNDENLKKWLLEYAKENIQEGKSWNLKESISTLSREIFKEDYKRFNDVLITKLEDKSFLSNYKSKILSISNSFEKEMKNRANEAIDLLETQSLSTSSFSYGKSSFANYFNKIISGEFSPSTRARNAAVDIDSWMPKKCDLEIKSRVDGISSMLQIILGDIINFYEENYFLYNSVKIVLNNIHTLGILTDISKQIRFFTQTENVFLLTDSAQLLNAIIGNNNSPFIYEKVGSNYKNFMIDEFQDTSSMQWDNFKPLIENSLSEGNFGLIVGDVKQSIYRWRNGDWKLLDNIVEEEFSDLGVNIHTLDKNWRSSTNIIKYNNSIFYYCSLVLQKDYNNSIPAILNESLEIERNQIEKAYATSYQDIPDEKINNSGDIKHYYLESEKDYPFADKALDKLQDTIKELQESGYKASDIAILVRKAKEGRMVADKLMECKNQNPHSNIVYDFISNDSLYLKNSSCIKLITNAIKYLLNTNNKIYLQSISYEYLFYRNQQTDVKDAAVENIPKEYLDNIEVLKRMPLYELSEEIIQIFHLNINKEYIPYLQAFQDMVADYCTQNGSDIGLFMEWWDDNKDKKVISVSEKQEAIKILTIHKSKGLEFKAVIIPFCDWKLNDESLGNILWSKPLDSNLSDLDILPIKYSKKLEESIFFKDYYQEKLKTLIDNLNLLYVAYTRAENVLISYSPLPKKGELEKLSRISDLLFHIYQNNNNYSKYDDNLYYTDISKYWNNNDFCFEINGDVIIPNNIEDEYITHELNNYTSESIKERLHIKLNNADYFDFQEKEDINEFAPISKGNIIHSVFENIVTIQEIDKAIHKLVVDGKISSKQVISIKNEIEQLFINEEVIDWFSGKWDIIMERDIMTDKGDIIRPDRIMIKDKEAIIIDYKSGKDKLKSYNKKMAIYCQTLRGMGYLSVKGYIWYLRDNTLEEVI